MRYFLCVVIALTLGASVHAQTIFGTNTGTFADWLGTYAMTDVPLREWGTVSDPSDPNSSVDGPNGSLITDGGTVTYAVNYPAGTYVISFNSPSPVTISTTGILGPVSNVTQNGTLETMDVAITTSGVSATNPLTNFQLVQSGQTGAQLTPTFNSYMIAYQAVRWMNNLNINNNTTLETSANLVPSGSNFGSNSYQDIVNWANAQSNMKDVMISIPVNADSTFIAAVAKTMSGLRAGITCIVESSNETWNYSFSQAGWMQNLGASDPRVTDSDLFGKNGQEAGLHAAAMMTTFKANFTGPGAAVGFLDSQGGNTYYVDQEKGAITSVYGAAALDSLFKYQGISFYPGDGLSSASSASALYSGLESDLTRLTGYLKTDASDAAASGLSECVYEWSPNGYLTLGDISSSVISAFRASPLSEQVTLDTWNAINNNIGPNGVAFDFDITGDGWSTQEDPLDPTEEEQLAIDQIAGVPEPSIASLALCLAASAMFRRRRSKPIEQWLGGKSGLLSPRIPNKILQMPKLREDVVRRTHPVLGPIAGWYFRCEEQSNNVWLAEGTDLWGRKVAATDHDYDRS